MRTPRRVKQKMYYSMPNAKITVYKRDANGNIVYKRIDGKMIPLKTGEEITGYSEEVEFINSITGTLTADDLAAFGSDVSGTAKITYINEEFPFVVGTRIWRTSEVGHKDSLVDEKTADYEVVKVLKGRTFTRCLLKEVVK